MSSNRFRLDKLGLGMLTGILAPFLGLVVFYFVQSAEMNGLEVDEYMDMLSNQNILSMILSWSLLANLACFALLNKLEMLRAAQGVVFSTLLYGMVIIYLKMV